MPGFQDPEG